MASKIISIRVEEKLYKKLKANAEIAGKELSRYCRDVLSMEQFAELQNKITTLQKALESERAKKHAGGRPKRLQDDDNVTTTILELYRQNNSICSIAKQVEIPYSTVYRICKPKQ